MNNDTEEIEVTPLEFSSAFDDGRAELNETPVPKCPVCGSRNIKISDRVGEDGQLTVLSICNKCQHTEVDLKEAIELREIINKEGGQLNG
jgi:Zn finger protein HypA/HybF involved in hydrogenase expression